MQIGVFVKRRKKNKKLSEVNRQIAPKLESACLHLSVYGGCVCQALLAFWLGGCGRFCLCLSLFGSRMLGSRLLKSLISAC